VEYIDIDWTPHFPPGFTPPEQVRPMVQWWQAMQEGSHRFGRPVAYPTDMDSLLECAGFTDSTHRTIRIQLQPPSSASDDSQERVVERSCKVLMYQLNKQRTACESLEALCQYFFVAILDWKPDDVRRLCLDVARVGNSKRLPTYFNLYVLRPLTQTNALTHI
jgi:hypothetical protein